MVNCPNCNVEVRDRGLSMHLSRYCRMRDVATTSALTERLEHRQTIAQAARVEEERKQQEEHEVPDIEADSRPSGRPNRQIRLPKRYRDEVPVLPIPAPPPVEPDEIAPVPDDPDNIAMDFDDRPPSDHAPPTEQHRTDADTFDLFREYPHSFPTYDPEHSAYFNALCDSSTFQHVDGDADYERPWYAGFGQSLEAVHHNYFAPFLNATVFRLMTWFYNSSISKSLQDLNRLVNDVILAEDFC
ncbi:hypothetical protein DEU56DRAFT_761545 [Suillus clintonianus]|uniref:uncharacterized protein n=1 Tax=Suillus clintonianus TaxID=1904413 RepID=UPI001B86268B|nr:uncharacterized protein DEU56DRAFT_761545 [Suillus clintonianus]KAG2116269.1 hypothetical protein DEU56DRAFT_761545 [Suillus clintonianus]